MGRWICMMVTYPSSFSRFRCTLSEKLISEIFNHFPFFLKSMHPLITIMLCEVHDDDRNMLSKFHINLIYRSGAIAKTSFGPAKNSTSAAWGCRSEREASSYSMNLARGYLYKGKTTMNQQPSHHATTKTNACSSQKHLTATIWLQVRD